jgi:hemerythrin
MHPFNEDQTMDYWTWDPVLLIGVDTIDTQHRRIVDYINELHIAHLEKNQNKVSQVLAGLVDYTLTHFAFEEGLMVIVDYPVTDAHKKAHARFTARVHNYKKQHEAGQDVTMPLMSELKLWLTNHIKNEDKHYAPYVQKVFDDGWMSRLVRKFFK